MTKIKKLIAYSASAVFACASLASCGCDHNYEHLFTDTATCVKAGTVTVTCSHCGEVIETRTSPAKGHDFSIFVKDTATCDKDGYKTFRCSRCGETCQKSSRATGHDYVGCKCSKCGKIDPECDAGRMKDSYSYSKQYTLENNYSTVASVFCTLKMDLGSSDATFGVVGNIYESSIFTMSIYDSKGAFMENSTIAFFGSYSRMQSDTNTIHLPRALSSGELFYIKVSASVL